MMALAIIEVTKPSILNDQQNGKLDSKILLETPGLNGGPTIRLVTTATRCWRALSNTAYDEGIVLQATSIGDSYRNYDRQLATWNDRYEPDPFPGYIGVRWWPEHYDEQGRLVKAHRWYQKPRTAVAAVPGTSNHGWGLAVDVANAAGKRLDWLSANAVKFGWSWETLPSEPWHIRNVTGDNIPLAVLNYEQGIDDMTPEQWLSLQRVESYLFWGTLNLEDPFRVPPNTVGTIDNKLANEFQNLKTQLNDTDAQLEAIKAQLDEIKTMLGQGNGGGTSLAPHTHDAGTIGPAIPE
jgi:hypothetical protein